jgi:hypothetical protein
VQLCIGRLWLASFGCCSQTLLTPTRLSAHGELHCCSCVLMPAAAPLVCANGAELKNVGNVRLSNVTIRGSVNCSIPQGQLLLPGDSLNCTVSVLMRAFPTSVSHSECESQQDTAFLLALSRGHTRLTSFPA